MKQYLVRDIAYWVVCAVRRLVGRILQGGLAVLACALPLTNALAFHSCAAALLVLWLPSLFASSERHSAASAPAMPPKTATALPIDAVSLPDTNAERLVLDTTALPASLRMHVPDSLQQSPTFASSTDSLFALPFDSTARLEQFRYQRRDLPSPSLSEPFVSPLFLPQSAIKREVSLDSLGETITISETVGGYPVKPVLRVPFELYKKLRFEAALKQNFSRNFGTAV
ncbi:MAG: hypothetical protein RML35_03730 [Chloroherpetonaceae bacterium]|nr:hypothetical protein [Chloroherpetonaceae bacterium]